MSISKKGLVFCLVLIITHRLHSQYIKEQPGVWIALQEPVAYSMQSLRELLELGPEYQLKLVSSDIDKFKRQHRLFQEYHKGTMILGAQVRVHTDDSGIFLINGRLPKSIELDVNEVSSTKGISGNETAILGPDIIGGDAYKLCLKQAGEKPWKIVYADVNTGEVQFESMGPRHVYEKGIAKTRFSGEVEITSEKINNEYRLRSTYNDVKIRTLNAQQIPVDSIIDHFETVLNNGAIVDFYDSDNFWDNFNEVHDELAGDIHYGTETTLKYFDDVHSRNGIDGKGGDVLSIIHIGDNWDDAFYLPPPYDFMGYGDGGLLATLDVVAHEMTHGLVRHTAALLYINESSILDESFADIFATSVKFSTDPPELDNKWELAEQLGTFRSLQNPKLFRQPDTYHGSFWYVGNNRSWFAHQNNGIPNYWFYLLSEGGIGINDNGVQYNIEGIGIDAAIELVYHTLTTYLTNRATLADARLGTIQSANDLYGDGFQADQVRAAWDAVGVMEVIANVKENVLADQNISVYPNPASRLVYLNIPNVSSLINVKCLSISGQIVLNREIVQADNMGNVILDIENLSAGVYQLIVDTPGYLYSEKFVKN